MKKRILMITGVMWAALSGSVQAQLCGNYADGSQHAANVVVPGARLQAVATDGVNLVVAAEAGEVSWCSLDADGFPVLAGTCTLDATLIDVVLTGTIACVAMGGDGVALVDFADPTLPVLRSTVPTDNVCLDLAVGDGLLMVAEGAAGLRLIDISNPSAPVQAAALAVEPAEEVAWEDDICHVAGGLNRWVYDVSNHASPDILYAHVDNSFEGYVVTDLQLSGGRRYLASRGVDMGEDPPEYFEDAAISDISDPSNPVLLGSRTVSPAVGVPLVTGDGNISVIFIGGNLEFSEIGNQVHPFSVFSGASVIAMAAAGNRLYAVHDGTIEVYEVGLGIDPFQTAVVLRGDPGDDRGDLLRVGDVIYSSGHHEGDVWTPESYSWIDRVDISDPANPVHLTMIAPELWGTLTAVLANHDDLLFTSVGVFDLTTSARVGTFSPGVRNFVVGDVLGTFDSSGAEMFDLSDPIAPVHRGTVLDGRFVQSVTASSSYGFLWMRDGNLAVLDVANPAAPAVVGDVVLPVRCDVGCRRGDLLIGAGQNILLLFDISIPSQPVQIGSLVTEGLAVAISEPSNVIYLTMSDGAFVVVDVSNPEAPFERARFVPDAASFGHVDALDGFFVGVGNSLRKYLYDCGDDRVPMSGVDDPPSRDQPVHTRPYVAAAYPNPFNAGLRVEIAAVDGDFVGVGVHDLRGRMVRRLKAVGTLPGEQHYDWDGRDSSGRVMPSGVYLIVVESHTGMTSRRVSLVK